MILKSLSVGVACLAFGLAAGAPIAAQNQKPGSATSQTNRGTTAAQPQNRPPSRTLWWSDEKTKKELGLTPVQVKAIDDIYNSSKDEIASYRESTERERRELDKMIAESKVEQWVVLRQIDRMETQRTSYNKTLWMMLYRMNRQLTPEQRVKLQELEQKARSGRSGDRRDPKPTR